MNFQPIIDGFRGNGYKFTMPVDRSVHLNKDVYKYITVIGHKPNSFLVKCLKKIETIYSRIPQSIKQIPKQ